ncbi:hypothetical protein CAPTEDRAFT_92293 [Capitella teleta]|uniref:Ionotropic glutamate receptor L-glutamate and glycine-binding domain-containing protein n=1 Tax=Capitella teleta TaxID=283909 RepID=R7T903_CAPTE|nr:hypothetical protein CAPTEDRAFT_92293 [Capitella teleta]|eukprot:ELT90213.1 hypothetical protein CAPTEDRAFT_92293 [Capitella teleta]
MINHCHQFCCCNYQEQPWTMLKTDHEDLIGNDKYYGFAVDLIDVISQVLGFTYEIIIVHDGKFGSKLTNGEWDGIVGEILSGNASMSVAPLSINADREAALDFTKPFKTRGITVLIKTPKSQSSFWQFMLPLSTTVWLLVFMSFIVLSISLFFLEKVSVARTNVMPKLDSVTESGWFMFASLVGGGAEAAPTTLPGRIMSSGWWFFSLILISTYTANLAAFLTVKKINPPISKVGELIDQSTMKYGTVSDSGVETFFKSSKVDPFWRMYEQMALFDDMMVSSTEEGLSRVLDGDYAFLWDNSVNSYLVTTQCEFTEIGPAFDAKGFGIGLPPGSLYLEQLSMAILKLADSGRITEMEYK